MMIDHKINRPYIERLRNDPRTRALFDSWVHQGMMIAEQRVEVRGERDAKKLAHVAAQEAVRLAMEFVLENDGEYKHVCDERDAAYEKMIETANLSPRLFVQK